MKIKNLDPEVIKYFVMNEFDILILYYRKLIVFNSINFILHIFPLFLTNAKDARNSKAVNFQLKKSTM